MSETYEDFLPKLHESRLEKLYERQLVLEASKDPIRYAREQLALSIVIRQKEYSEAREKDLALIEETKKANRNAWIAVAVSIIALFSNWLVAVFLGK